MSKLKNKISKELLAYKRQLAASKGRKDRNGNPIEFKLSFQEWLDIWTASGKLDQRGCQKGCYCMARHNDIGHYEVGNVSIILHSDNIRQRSNVVGEKHFKSKLTEADVINMRAEYKQGATTIKALAKKYNIARNTAMGIIHYKAWKHVA